MTRSRWRGRCIAELPWDWDRMDVLLKRRMNTSNVLVSTLCSLTKANVTPEFFPSFPRRFDWANTSEGAEHLALCVLDRFLPPEPGEQVTIDGVDHACSKAAWTLHLPFMIDVVRYCPVWNATILGTEIHKWLARNQRHYSIVPSCVALERRHA
jgi:hypothetical protein